MIVFGGMGPSTGDSSFRNDLRQHDVVLNRWQEVTHLGALPKARYRHSVVLSESTDELFVLGGVLHSSAQLNDLWLFKFDTNKWYELFP